MKSIRYSIIIIKFNIIKTVFKLTELFQNLEFKNMQITDSCFKYLYSTKHFDIQYLADRKSNLTIKSNDNIDNKQIIKITTDVFFASNKDF